MHASISVDAQKTVGASVRARRSAVCDRPAIPEEESWAGRASGAVPIVVVLM
jgi:hypothetical protein